jgi:CRISPR/Cas system endoribonuclease Cas6 (RAMP superfamily)
VLRWHEQTRFSARQRMAMQMGGIVGTCRIDLGDAADALVPWLSLAQWVGAGKGASMGMGDFRLTAAAS